MFVGKSEAAVRSCGAEESKLPWAYVVKTGGALKVYEAVSKGGDAWLKACEEVRYLRSMGGKLLFFGLSKDLPAEYGNEPKQEIWARF